MTLSTVEFEGGPWDGRRASVDDGCDTLYVPLRASPYVAKPPGLRPAMRKGIYLRDRLDHHTMEWGGEI